MLLIISFCFISLFSDSITNFINKKTAIKPSEFGLYISDLGSKTIYSHNKNKLFSIASLNKLYTTLASIHYLGDGYRFKTNVYGIIKKNKVETLVIKGGGDPLFVPKTLWELVNKIKILGIKNIDTIVLDNSMFTPYKIGFGDRAYSTQVLPFSFNFNSIALNIVSGPEYSLSLFPFTKKISLKNQISLCKFCRTRTGITREKNRIFISGFLNTKDYSFKTKYRNLDNPIEILQESLRNYLSFLEIQVKNIVSSFSSIKKLDNSLLFSVKSRRLEDILTDMNRFSNNFIAELLFKQLEFITGQKGIYVISNFGKKYLGASENFNMVDASGMSLLNKSSVFSLVSLLKKVYNDFKIAPSFINSLSVSGKDGTIKSLKTSFFIRAKTGTLNTVKGFAGYILYKEKVYPFAIVANGNHALQLNNIFNSILLKIFKENR